jgi:hypothetical protein
MKVRGVPVRIALWLAVCSCPGLCQDPPIAAPSPSLPATGVYESFFRLVVQRNRIASNPEVPAVAHPTVQSEFGFTDREMQWLNATAADCEARLSAIRQRQPGPRIIFEARLDAIESGQSSVRLAQQLKEMDDQIAQAISQLTQQLKVALGDARFQKLDAWVRAGAAKGCFIAPCAAARR